MESIFADTVAEVTVGSGVVRITLGVQRQKSRDAKPELVPVSSINLPIDGFANSVVVLQGLVDKLVKDGVLKTKAGSPASSPNFN
jgi:hypothetical protein